MNKQVFQIFPFHDSEPSSYNIICNEVNAKHNKDLLVSKPVFYQLAEWRGDVSARRFTIKDEELIFECYGTPSKVKRLFIFLSAGGGAIRSGNKPEFQRASWHPWFNGVSLNIGDPTFLAYPGKLNTGWYLGTKKQDAMQPLASIVEKVRAKYRIEPFNTYIIGSSAGGTSALKLAGMLDGVTAIAENPPMYPHKRGSSKNYTDVGIKLSDKDFRKRNSLLHLLNKSTSRYFVLQNGADKNLMKHLTDFLLASGCSTPSLGLNVYGSLNVYCSVISNQSPHHTFMSVSELVNFIQAIDQDIPQNHQAILLSAIYDGMRARILQADKIKNLNGWSKLLPSLNMPALAIPLPSDHHVLKIPLVDNNDIFYKATLSHNGKKVTMSLDVLPIFYESKENVFSEALDKSNAKLVDENGVRKLTIANVSVEKAPQQLRHFVHATLPIFQAVI